MELKTFPAQNLYTDIRHIFIYNCQNQEATTISQMRLTDKLDISRQCKISTNNEWAIKPWKYIENVRCMSLSERNQSEKTTYWKRSEHRDIKRPVFDWGLEEGRMNRTEGPVLYTVQQCWTSVTTHFSNVIECTTSGMNSNIIQGLLGL